MSFVILKSAYCCRRSMKPEAVIVGDVVDARARFARQLRLPLPEPPAPKPLEVQDWGQDLVDNLNRNLRDDVLTR